MCAKISPIRRFVMGVGHFNTVNIRWKDYVYRQHLWTLDKEMVILQLCRWKISHKETLQQTLFDIKRLNRFLSHPLGDLGVTYALLL